MEGTKRPPTSRAEWAKRVERWKQSGLTAEAFASELGINSGTLKYWKYVLGRAARGGGAKRCAGPRCRKPKFVEVTAAAAAETAKTGASPSLLLETPGGYRVVVPEQFKTEHLAQVLQALESRQ